MRKKLTIYRTHIMAKQLRNQRIQMENPKPAYSITSQKYGTAFHNAQRRLHDQVKMDKGESFAIPVSREIFDSEMARDRNRLRRNRFTKKDSIEDCRSTSIEISRSFEATRSSEAKSCESGTHSRESPSPFHEADYPSFRSSHGVSQGGRNRRNMVSPALSLSDYEAKVDLRKMKRQRSTGQSPFELSTENSLIGPFQKMLR